MPETIRWQQTRFSAVGLTLATPDEHKWAALTQSKMEGMLVDSHCTNHIEANINAFLDFVPIESVVLNPKGQIFKVVTSCVGIRTDSDREKF